MYQFLFRNKWAAIAFVVLTLVSVQMLVGSEGEKSVISRTQDQLLDQRQHMQQTMDDLGNGPPLAELDAGPDAGPGTNAEGTDVGLADDKELIDDAAGLDPSPVEEQPAETSSDEESIDN